VTALAGLAGSFLGDIDDAAREVLLADAIVCDFARGQTVFGDAAKRRIGFIVEGTARAYMTGPDGRQLTVRYVRSRSMITSATAAVASNPIAIGHQAVTDLAIVEFAWPRLIELQDSNASVVRALASESNRRLADVYRAFAATFFGSLRERLAAHLLDSAELDHGNLVAPLTQQELAVALATAREVVGRALQQFQADGLVAIKRGGITIVDTRGLSGAAGTWWVPSRASALDGAVPDASFDDSRLPVVAIDGSGAIVYANSAVEGTFGCSPRAIVGHPLTAVLQSSDGPSLDALLDELMRRVAPGPINVGGKFHGVRADGTNFPAEISTIPVQRGDATVVFATVVDVTYRSALRELLARRGVAATQAAPR
jgi:CRP/FNR family cyclic AMP-dependent transcriptional regulator